MCSYRPVLLSVDMCQSLVLFDIPNEALFLTFGFYIYGHDYANILKLITFHYFTKNLDDLIHECFSMYVEMMQARTCVKMLLCSNRKVNNAIKEIIYQMTERCNRLSERAKKKKQGKCDFFVPDFILRLYTEGCWSIIRRRRSQHGSLFKKLNKVLNRDEQPTNYCISMQLLLKAKKSRHADEEKKHYSDLFSTFEKLFYSIVCELYYCM